MEKVGLGTKRVCPSCGARFYDLLRRPIECPKCRFAFEPEALLRARRPRPDLREITVPVKKPSPEIVEEEEEGAEEEITEPLEEEEEGEEVVEEELAEGEAEKVPAPAAEARRRKRKPSVEGAEDTDEEGETLEGEREEVLVEDELEEDEDVSDIIEEDLDEEEGR